MTDTWRTGQRTRWWVRYGAVIGVVVPILTLLGTCGGLRIVGVQMKDDADLEHRAIRREIVEVQDAREVASERMAVQRQATVDKRLDELTATIRDIHQLLLQERRRR